MPWRPSQACLSTLQLCAVVSIGILDVVGQSAEELFGKNKSYEMLPEIVKARLWLGAFGEVCAEVHRMVPGLRGPNYVVCPVRSLPDLPGGGCR